MAAISNSGTYTINVPNISNMVTITGSGSSTGTSGQVYTTTGTNGSWVNTVTNPYDSVFVVRPEPSSLEVKGRLIHNGQDLEERLKTIETVLQIPERDVKLEKKHPKLKKLYDEYIQALGKYRTFEAIKGEDDGTT